MNKATNRSKKENLRIVLCVGAGMALVIGAQGAHLGAAVEDVEVVETEITSEQILSDEQNAQGERPAAGGSVNDSLDDLSMAERQMAVINTTLKNVIEENKKLLDEKVKIENELKELRGQTEIRASRLNTLTRQRDELEKRITDTEEAQGQYALEIEQLKKDLADKEKELTEKLTTMQEAQAKEKEEQEKAMAMVLPGQKDAAAVAESKKQLQDIKMQAKETLNSVEDNVKRIAGQISELNLENKKLKQDSVKLHYNMGNNYFEQGKYKKAAAEYQRVIDLTPNDAAAHYNLAFVASEFLKDQKLALEHYQQYLYLSPDAEDALLVKEKILHAQLTLKTQIDSVIEEKPKKIKAAKDK
ncbi:MAG: tetratricopeptide repeat protein [Candidatus Omnitrophota bacterium]